MLKNIKNNWLENWDSICIGLIMMNGGYYRPYEQ